MRPKSIPVMTRVTATEEILMKMAEARVDLIILPVNNHEIKYPLSALYSVERRLAKNYNLAKKYEEFLHEQETVGHMRKLSL